MTRIIVESVVRITHDFADAWNHGDLERACEMYAEKAIYISPAGFVQGRENILEQYRNAYPERSLMGVLTLKLVEFRATQSQENDAAMATAVWRWKVKTANAEHSGFCLEVYEQHDGQIRVVVDASV